MTDSRPEQTSVVDALLPKTVATVQFGGKTYELKPMSVGQLIELIQIVGAEFGYLATIMQENEKKPAAERFTQADMIMTMLSLLKEEKIVRLMAIILQEDNKVVKENFNLADALDVIDVVTDLEDIERVFFRLSKMGKKAREKMAKKAPSTNSSNPSNTSVLSMVGKTNKSSENPSSGSTPNTPSPEGEDTTAK